MLNWFVSAASLHCHGCKGGRRKDSSCLGNLMVFSYLAVQLMDTFGTVAVLENIWNRPVSPQWSLNLFSFIISNFILPPYLVSFLPSLCLVVVFQVNVVQGRWTAQKGLNGGGKGDVVTSQSSYSSSLHSAEWPSNANHVAKSPLHQFKCLKFCETVD